jgi:ABC-2 type transport system permease protein
MIKTLIDFEVKNWLLKPTTIILLLLWSVTLIFSISNGTSQLESRQARMDSLTNIQTERLAKHPALMDSFATGRKVASVYWDDARNAFDIGYVFGKKYLFKPVNQPALAIGQSSLQHSDHELTTSSEFWFSALRKAERMDNPTTLIYGFFDAAFVLVWLLPLVIIVLTYNMFSAEREQGTIKMLLVQGLTVKSLLLTRTLFRFAVIVIFTILVVLVALLFLQEQAALNGLVYFVLFTVLYTLLWHAVSLVINLFNRSSNYNAGILFTIWIAGVLVLPALINVLVTNIKPIPGKVILINEVREKLTENDQKNSEILDQFYTDHPEFIIKDSAKLMPLFMYKYMIKEMTTSEQLQPIMDDYKEKLELQSKTVNMLATVIPSMAYQEALEEISGNSLSQYLAFQRFADHESRSWRNYFHPISLANSYLTIDEFKSLPHSSFTTPFDSGKNGLLLLSLIVWNTAVLIVAFVKMKKYKLE